MFNMGFGVFSTNVTLISWYCIDIAECKTDYPIALKNEMSFLSQYKMFCVLCSLCEMTEYHKFLFTKFAENKVTEWRVLPRPEVSHAFWGPMRELIWEAPLPFLHSNPLPTHGFQPNFQPNLLSFNCDWLIDWLSMNDTFYIISFFTFSHHWGPA